MYLVMEKKRRIITRWAIHISLQVRYRSRTVQVQVGGRWVGKWERRGRGRSGSAGVAKGGAREMESLGLAYLDT